ncbi:alpha/beta hydrolase family protein [Amycolatopsis sacchari]|uniref:alpha/beta hydrolase family protein n=1 Tax=Amycolatopsis sacchari TaxID=115433 RepID=UPI003D708481
MATRKIFTVALASLLTAVVLPGTAAARGACDARVPGAQYQESVCLSDLTATGTTASGHTVAADWAGLTSAGLPVPGPVPGVQVDGYFPDDSTTNTNHGWNHDAQFVLRLPRHWNGGLVVGGSPGNRRQYANDRAIADQVLARGYAFAATDKGNTGTSFSLDGKRAGDAIAEWNFRVTQLTVAAKAAATRFYGRPVTRTLAAGLSNGGYLVRWQLENRPALYDGGVDWEGTLWTQRDNLLVFLPSALRGSAVEAGFAAQSEFLWPYHRDVYWELTQRIYREELDPGYRGNDADYDYASRPESVHRAVDRIALTGRIGKPVITLHGTLDSLLPISRDSDVYDRMITNAGRGSLHRYYRIEGGNHVDALYDTYPDRLRPMGPCFRSAFTALEGWLDGVRPPGSTTVSRPANGNLAAECSLVGAGGA